ncbi:tRNA (adenine(58)-N(1))-methyltransferase non-catalytic subunit TRM6-like isoform X2 [Dreissena polymorpha]|uniref:tRNA (adenine(58)-N(1))-methyltransferase non-catalytic subunit TRM6-like isoform X2 n=1 Tax=Dreissena polymorpha TaxID=45954 RepID=UPI002263C8DE|nr:tRNA (adenine(58)-N(1))-methyltransferase non-catalytic subunit TRM6-like isoform X2 [Dreissena polymorpha]
MKDVSRSPGNLDVWLEKNKFLLDGILGHMYGTLFEVKDGQMVKVERTIPQDVEIADECVGDNRDLLDNDSNQKLTQDEIEQMKKEGVSGDHLIEQLIENSATFQNKTGYAQEKWVKKKKKKHLLQFTVLKPTARLLCEMQWSKGPSRISNLRVDSLAQMLTMGNVHANSTVLVVDSCMGLISAAVLERLAGYGRMVCFFHGDSPLKQALEPLDFPQKVMNSLYQFPLDMVNSLKHTKVENGEHITEEKDASKSSDILVNEESHNSEKTDNVQVEQSCATDVGIDLEMDTKENEEEAKEQEMDVKSESKDDVDIKTIEKKDRATRWKKKEKKNKKDRAEAKQERAREIERARKVLLDRKADCLLVATKFHPTPIVLALVDLIAPSRQIVVFSQFKEALQDCYMHLREHKGLVNYRLTETWLREYQVLPNRTHPVIQMSGTGGYLLSATTIVKQT